MFASPLPPLPPHTHAPPLLQQEGYELLESHDGNGTIIIVDYIVKAALANLQVGVDWVSGTQHVLAYCPKPFSRTPGESSLAVRLPSLQASSAYTSGPRHRLFSLTLNNIYRQDLVSSASDFTKIEGVPVRRGAVPDMAASRPPLHWRHARCSQSSCLMSGIDSRCGCARQGAATVVLLHVCELCCTASRLQGVYIANQMVPRHDGDDAIAQLFDRPLIETRVTFNGGGSWEPIPVSLATQAGMLLHVGCCAQRCWHTPSPDVVECALQAPKTFNHPTCDRCGGQADCRLHLHGSSSWFFGAIPFPSVYSHPSAPGVVMATGNVGTKGVGLDDNDG